MDTQLDDQSLVRRRYHTHRLAAPLFPTATAVVTHFAAVQGQDFLPAMWALGLRTAGATEASVEQAINDRQLVRTWPLRNTVHFVTAADVRWLLALSASCTRSVSVPAVASSRPMAPEGSPTSSTARDELRTGRCTTIGGGGSADRGELRDCSRCHCPGCAPCSLSLIHI